MKNKTSKKKKQKRNSLTETHRIMLTTTWATHDLATLTHKINHHIHLTNGVPNNFFSDFRELKILHFFTLSQEIRTKPEKTIIGKSV